MEFYHHEILCELYESTFWGFFSQQHVLFEILKLCGHYRKRETHIEKNIYLTHLDETSNDYYKLIIKRYTVVASLGRWEEEQTGNECRKIIQGSKS